jgi:hypothetical protein
VTAYKIGETLGVLGEARWTAYGTDDGTVVAAAYIRGQLVLGDLRNGWYVKNFDGTKRLPLTPADIEQIVACRPDDIPVLGSHRDLIPAVGDDDSDDDSGPPGSTWGERPLHDIVTGLIDGTIRRPEPTIGQRTDDVCLFYPGRVNGLHGPMGEGKTHVGMYAMKQQIEAGEHVILVDLEDDEAGAVGRLLEIGVAPDVIIERFHYVSPTERYGDEARQYLFDLINKYRPALVIVDSTGEALSLDGINANDDSPVAAWFRKLPRAIARTGAAVICIDHVVKSKENRGLNPIGSQRKLAAITGAAYMVEAVREFGLGQHGTAKLTVAKDRCGTFVRNTVAATFSLDATAEPSLATLDPPDTTGAAARGGGPWRPTILMERASRWLEYNPGANKTDFLAAIGSKAEHARQAVAALIDDDYVKAESEGPGKPTLHTVIRPYRETENTYIPGSDLEND